ncbi:MAG TPA: serine--tRNA ligase [Dehalococcoidia bacterium]|nr:serine--tRNA ligase [Dehalococcoidia bacterium]
MLSIQTIREQTDAVRQACTDRQMDVPIDEILRADSEHRTLLGEVEALRAERNRASKAIGAAKDAAERQQMIEAQRAAGSELDALEGRLREADATLTSLLLQVPNLFDERVPLGGESDAVVVIEGDGRAGTEQAVEPTRRAADDPAPPEDASRRPHWEIGEALGLIDFERGAKVAGSRFYILKGDAARLQRALIAWMIDVHREQGYREVYVPFVVKEEMLVGTGQLPKFAETMYHDVEDDLWLVPTAEVPVTNMYRDEIVAASALPIRHVAYTPSFRRERMSAGRDVRGIKRGHQFDKVEMVQFTEEGASWDALEQLVQDALAIVRALGFRYRVIRLASADITFASAMTYDIEVWAPGSREWLEVSSVSNFLDFQARRANLRYRDAEGRVRHLNTLNGSGLALPRVLATVLEQYERPEGIEVPAPLRPYLGGLELIEAQPAF